MEEKKIHFVFKGNAIIESYGRVLEKVPFFATTLAPSEKKALANLRYRFCKQNGREPYYAKHIRLEGKLLSSERSDAK